MVNGMGNNMCGMVRYSITMVQYNYGTVSLITMVQYMIWYIWYGMIQYNYGTVSLIIMVQYMAWYGIVWYGMVQYSIVQYDYWCVYALYVMIDILIS